MSLIQNKKKELFKRKKGNSKRLMALTVKAVLLNDKEEVLILKRSSQEKTNQKKWDLPGGYLEKGETLKEALLNEIKEETGVIAEIGPIIRISEFPQDHPAFKEEKRGVRFLAFCKGREVKLSQEHEDFKWLSLEKAIDFFDDKDGFEKEKKETIEAAKEWLEMKKADERWKRALADLENYKRISAKEKEEFKKYCLENFILELLPVLDNFEQALLHLPKELKGNNWIEGILHIKKQLLDVLEKFGVKEIDAQEGDEVDEKIHEAVMGKTKKEKPIIKKIIKKGYRLGEKIIRPVMIEID